MALPPEISRRNKMANSKANSGGSAARTLSTPAQPFAMGQKVKYKPLYYLAAFLIPFLLTLVAYINFDVYPFGERSVLTLDLNGQYIYYFEALRDAFWGDGSAFYNWSRNLSGGFMGIIGYYLASPFTLIVMLLPRKMILESVMIMQMAKVGAAGLTFFIYAQKSKNLRPLQSIVFSTMYSMMAYIVIQLIDPMWIDGPVFLPLIILGVEYLIDDGRKLNYIIPTAIMFIANFYIGFMIAIFVACYFFYYLLFGTKRKFNGAGDYVKTVGLMGISTFVVLLCSIIMILPVYNALALGKFDFSVPDYSFRTMFNPIELVPTLLPNQYYSVNVDEGTRFYGRPEIYSGVLTFILFPLFYWNKKINLKNKIGYTLLAAILFVSMYIKPVNMMWHGGQDPNWLPYRYSFLVSFVLISMAAEIFSKLDGYKLSLVSTGSSLAIIGGLVAWFCVKMKSFNYNESKYKYVAITPYKDYMEHGGEKWEEVWLGTIAFGMVLAAIYMVLVYLYSHSKENKGRNIITVCMAVLVFFEGGYNCFDSFRKIFKEVGNSDKSTYTEIMYAPNVMKELENYDNGFYRAEKTFNRMVNDDLAYGLRGISHSSSVMNARAIKFIETMGYFTQSFESKYEGSNPVADSILGIKYVLDDPNRRNGNIRLLDSSYIKRYSTTYKKDKDVTADLDVYENPNALNIGYMAEDDILTLTGLGNDNPFNSLNNFLSSMTGNTLDYSTVPIIPKEYYKPFDYEVSFYETKVYLHDYTNGGTGTVHDCYEAFAGVDDAVVNIHVTVPHDGDIYMHLGSEMRKQCNVWVSNEKDDDGAFTNHKSYGSYFNTNSSPILRMGPFAEGDEVEIRLTIQAQGDSGQYIGSNEYIMVRKNAGFNFYYLDQDAFEEDITKLKSNQWNLDLNKSNERYLTGEIDAKDGQVMVTTIPYEPGWKIKVDGKTIDSLIEENKDTEGNVTLRNGSGDQGQVLILGTLIGVKLPAGHHTVSMKYTPPGFNTGVFTMLIGIAMLAMFYMYDKKHNSVLKERARVKALIKEGKDPYAEENQKKKVVDIIKSKGAVAEKPLRSAEEEAKEAAEKAEEAAEEIAEKAEDALKEAEETAEDAAETVEEAVEDAVEEAEEAVEETAEKAKEAVKETAQEAKEAVKKAAPKKKNNNGKKKKK